MRLVVCICRSGGYEWSGTNVSLGKTNMTGSSLKLNEQRSIDVKMLRELMLSISFDRSELVKNDESWQNKRGRERERERFF